MRYQTGYRYFPEGMVIYDSTTGDIDIIEGGQKDPISPQLYAYMGSPAETDIPDAEFQDIPAGPQYFPAGMFVENQDTSQISMIQNGERYFISPQMEQILSQDLADTPVSIPAAQYDAIPACQTPFYVLEGGVLYIINSSGTGTQVGPSGVTSYAQAGDGDLIILAGGNVYDVWNPLVPADSVPIGYDISSLNIAGNGDVIMLAPTGTVYDQWNPRVSVDQTILATNIKSLAVAGNGDLMMLDNQGTVYDQWNPRVSVDQTILATNIKSLAIAGNGDVITLTFDGNVYDQSDPRVPADRTQINNNNSFVTGVAIAGNGDPIMLTSDGTALDQWDPRVPQDFITIASGVTQLNVAGNGDVIMLIDGTVYDQWNPRVQWGPTIPLRLPAV